MNFFKLFLAAVFALGLLAPVQAKVLFKEKFDNWRDESSNPGFNATFKFDSESKIATLKTDSENSYGKVMSAEDGITVNINENTEFQFTLTKDIAKGDIKINVMTAGEPYDSHEIISAKYKKGIYKTKLAEKTPWSGEHSFWVEIWVEGFDRTAQIKNLKITDGKEEIKKATKTKKKYKKKRRVRKKRKK